MKHPLFAASVLSTAVGLALAAQAPSVRAQGANPPQIVKDNMARAAANKLEKCYGSSTNDLGSRAWVACPAQECQSFLAAALTPDE
jgi:hypothetical protein